GGHRGRLCPRPGTQGRGDDPYGRWRPRLPAAILLLRVLNRLHGYAWTLPAVRVRTGHQRSRKLPDAQRRSEAGSPAKYLRLAHRDFEGPLTSERVAWRLFGCVRVAAGTGFRGQGLGEEHSWVRAS